MQRTVFGIVRWDDTSAPVAGARVLITDATHGKAVAKATTRKDGNYAAKWDDRTDRGACPKLDLSVSDARGLALAATPIPALATGACEVGVDLTVPADRRSEGRRRPTVLVGPLALDADAVAKAQPGIVLDVARAMVDPAFERKVRRRLEALSPDLVPSRHLRRTLCGRDILATLDELIRVKRWPRDLALRLDDILRNRWPYRAGFAQQVHECPNFRITYQDSGPDAVDPDTSAQGVIDPGSSPPVLLTMLPAGGPPTYIKRICFWLERALATYINPPFGMRNPAAGGKIEVVVNSSAFGSANPSVFYINNALPPDVLCAVAVHELFHMVQFEYSGTGTWQSGMLEGGATWAEDTAADFMNRYLDEAGTNFNGSGYMIQPHTSLESSGFRYKTSLFFRYVAEQHSPQIAAGNEPLIGVETYRTIIERCEAGSWSSDDVRLALRQLPWYQDFYEFGYLDPARLDLTSAETTIGSFALAAYLKRLGANVPDRRFDFMEDGENIFIDDVIATVIPGTPLQATLADVTLAGTGTVAPTASATFASSVPRFGSRYYEITVDPAVTNVELQFTAAGGLTSGLFQAALIDEDGALREIYRTDRMNYTKRFPNLRDGKRLDKVVLVVTGAASAGTFTVTAAAATAAPDVMVTRWHSVMKNEYEVDPRNWAWTWVSPDVWVDNDLDGVADGEVFFNFNNKLHVRLHNKGNLAAAGISVELWYQDASGGLSNAGWLPVQNTGGVTQSLAGLNLAAGASQAWSVDWSPAPSGMSDHFCVRAIVTVPGDPNTDNKRVLSNFGNVKVKFGGFVDIRILRRNLDLLKPRRVELAVVPRLAPGLTIASRDLVTQRARVLDPGEVSQDELRLSYWPVKGAVTRTIAEQRKNRREPPCPCGQRRAPEICPDPTGHYPVDPRTLPPGIGGKPMITLVHLVDGVPQGGVTMMVTPDAGTVVPARTPRRAAGRRVKHKSR